MTKHRAAAFWVASVAAFACGNEEVVLFELPAAQYAPTGGAGGGFVTGGVSTGGVATGGSIGTGGKGERGGGPGVGSPCSGDADCPATWFCQTPDCETKEGICLPPPLFCVDERAEPRPVCGCNDVTYWNECERQRAGERSQRFGSCEGNARRCETAEDCGTSGAFCSKLNARVDRCGQPDTGTCWVLPEVCPPGDAMRWIECLDEPPMPQPGMPLPELMCVDTCTAIRSERMHFRAEPRLMCDDMPP